MPYVPKNTRATIESSPIGNCKLDDSRELAYAVIQLVLQYSRNDPKKLQEAIGTLESVKHEVYRKYVNPATAQAEFDHGSIE
jgi:hypothetical protein